MFSTVKIYTPGTYVQFINAGLSSDSDIVKEGLPSGMITNVMICENLSIYYQIVWWDGDERRTAFVSDLEFVVL